MSHRLRFASLSLFAIAATVFLTACTAKDAGAKDDAPAVVKPAATKPATRTAGTQPTSRPFEKDVLAYEADEQKNPSKPGGIVFFGSSSFRLWKTLKADFPGLPVINRGFGGSTFPDALLHLDRLVLPLKPATVLVYEGDNDLHKGRSPEQVLADAKTLASRIHAALPDAKIHFLATKPSPSRLRLLEKQKAANTAIEKWVKESGDKRLGYVDIFTPMLDDQGEPREELFVADRLHMNAEGYEIWTKVISAALKGE